jgi:hypothetical protein
VQFFLKNRDQYKEALKGVCYWRHTPSEVDFDAFKTWTAERLKGIDPEIVQWGEAFCELFL